MCSCLRIGCWEIVPSICLVIHNPGLFIKPWWNKYVLCLAFRRRFNLPWSQRVPIPWFLHPCIQLHSKSRPLFVHDIEWFPQGWLAQGSGTIDAIDTYCTVNVSTEDCECQISVPLVWVVFTVVVVESQILKLTSHSMLQYKTQIKKINQQASK